MDKKGFVYILESIDGKYYIGSTVDMENRLTHHLSHHTQTTRNMNEFSVVLVQEFDSLLEARRVENKLKKLKRKDYVEKMVKDGFIKIK